MVERIASAVIRHESNCPPLRCWQTVGYDRAVPSTGRQHRRSHHPAAYRRTDRCSGWSRRLRTHGRPSGNTMLRSPRSSCWSEPAPTTEARSASSATSPPDAGVWQTAVATELGLQATLLRPYGLASTAMLPATEARYAAVLGELTEVLVLWRASEPPRTRASSGRAGPPCHAGAPARERSVYPGRSSKALRWSAAAVERRFFPASSGGDPCPLHCRSNECNRGLTRGRGALTRTYLGASRAAEILGCTP